MANKSTYINYRTIHNFCLIDIIVNKEAIRELTSMDEDGFSYINKDLYKHRNSHILHLVPIVVNAFPSESRFGVAYGKRKGKFYSRKYENISGAIANCVHRIER